MPIIFLWSKLYLHDLLDNTFQIYKSLLWDAFLRNRVTSCLTWNVFEFENLKSPLFMWTTDYPNDSGHSVKGWIAICHFWQEQK